MRGLRDEQGKLCDAFRSDGLPAQFTNVWIEAFTKEAMRVPKAKRGIPLTVR